MTLYSNLTDEELVRAIDNLPNATDMERELAERLNRYAAAFGKRLAAALAEKNTNGK